MTWHFSTSNVPPRCQSLPQRRSKGSAKESGKAWIFLAKKIPERFPNWKFEDVFFGCLILVLVNDFAHLPWADSPNFQKNAHDSKDFPYINCWFSRFLGIFQKAPSVFFLASPKLNGASFPGNRSPRHHKWLLGGVHLANLQKTPRWSGLVVEFQPIWKNTNVKTGDFLPQFCGVKIIKKKIELPPPRWCDTQLWMASSTRADEVCDWFVTEIPVDCFFLSCCIPQQSWRLCLAKMFLFKPI